MTPYEDKRWSQLDEWHTRRPRSLAQRVPEGLRRRTSHAAERVAEVWEKVPGNDQVEQVIASAIQGSFHLAIDTTCRSIREDRVTRKVLGRSGGSYSDLKLLPLKELDGAAPSLKVSRSLVAATHGAAAGFVAGGSTAAGAASGGMGALPAAMAVAGSAAFDAGAVAVGSIQATALLGAHYGYDPSSPAEHAMMMSVLSGTLAGDAARVAMFRQIRQLALDLAAKRTVAQLSRHRLYQMMLKLYGAMLIKTTKRNVARGLPVVGVAIGAGTNYKTLRDTVELAQHSYPQRWMLEKYTELGVDVIDIETVEEAVDASIEDDDAGIIGKLEWTDEDPSAPPSQEEKPTSSTP